MFFDFSKDPQVLVLVPVLNFKRNIKNVLSKTKEKSKKFYHVELPKTEESEKIKNLSH